MQPTDNPTNVIDINSFRKQQELNQTAPQSFEVPEGYTPTLMWYPVWVLVPNQPQPSNTP